MIPKKISAETLTIEPPPKKLLDQVRDVIGGPQFLRDQAGKLSPKSLYLQKVIEAKRKHCSSLIDLSSCIILI
jgi:hypothetical protein